MLQLRGAFPLLLPVLHHAVLVSVHETRHELRAMYAWVKQIAPNFLGQPPRQEHLFSWGCGTVGTQNCEEQKNRAGHSGRHERPGNRHGW